MDAPTLSRPSPQWQLWALALLITLLNCPKPLAIDDVWYYASARRMADTPLDPFSGNDIVRVDSPALGDSPPPVFCAWWALGMRLLGDHELLWKCWLLPLAAVLVWALHALLRRFAAGVEGPVLWMTVLSPAVLPSFDYMLDLPALALSLAAVACFLKAVDRVSLGRALAAGLLGGLAMQTKYTGVTGVAALCAYGVLSGRWRLAFVAGATASLVFLAWEAALYVRYGNSTFLCYFAGRNEASQYFPWGTLCLPLATVLGCVAPALPLLGLAALRARTWLLTTAALAMTAAYAALAFVPARYAEIVDPPTGATRFLLSWITVDPIGFFLWGIAAVVLWRNYRHGWRRTELPDRFLLVWLFLEVAFYFPLSNFPAVRRVLSIMVVLTLILARAVSRRQVEFPRVATRLKAIAAFSGLVGMLFCGIDWYDASAQKQATLAADRYICGHGGGRKWFAGAFGCLYYAHRAGFQPTLAGRSRLQPGDWVVLGERVAGVIVFAEDYDHKKMEFHEEIVAGAALPLCTHIGFYYGGHPLLHSLRPQVLLDVFRVTQPFVPDGIRKEYK